MSTTFKCPKGCNSIVDVISSFGKIQICIITFRYDLRNYVARVYEEYEVSDLNERARFLLDLMKICRWMKTITGRNEDFHLISDTRRSTKQKHHYITWSNAD